jgi:asparagine synthase (glutamine-hydrolysing)
VCGIAGVVSLDGSPFDRRGLERMVRSLSHRGPDALSCASLSEGTVGLGHARLSIIDLETGGQPMASEDGATALVFNGEIYNYLELREELVREGCRFSTASDTEVLLRLLEARGPSATDLLRGMFAFAHHDARVHRTVLARDRLGKKPLFWLLDPRRLVFASETKAILAYLGGTPPGDWSFLGDYLALGYIPDPATPFAAIRKLPPAHRLVLEDGRPVVERYWSPRRTPASIAGAEEAERRLEEVLAEAVDIRLRSDVEFGALLSSGIDSGLVTSFMARSGKAGRPRTFSVGFREGVHDELDGARAVARHLDTVHREEVIDVDVSEVLPRIAWHMEEPFADSSAVPTYRVCSMAARHVKMVLSGDGGDELFGGYDRYRRVLQLERLRGSAAVRWAAAFARAGLGRRAARIGRLLEEDPAVAYAELVGIFPSAAIARLGVPLAGGYPPPPIPALWSEAAGHDIDRAMAVDLETYLPGDVLVKVDRMSMAHSLEVRSPLLDHRVVELASSVPAILKRVRPDRGKEILRRLARSSLPPDAVDLPKRGFSAPVDAWYCDGGELRRPLLREAAEGDEVLGRMDRGAVERLLSPAHLREPSCGERLFALHTLLLWHRLFVREFSASLAAFAGQGSGREVSGWRWRPLLPPGKEERR